MASICHVTPQHESIGCFRQTFCYRKWLDPCQEHFQIFVPLPTFQQTTRALRVLTHCFLLFLIYLTIIIYFPKEIEERWYFSRILKETYWFRYSNCQVGRDSSVSIATRYGLDGPGVEFRWQARFFASVKTGPGAHPASCTMGTGSFPGVKRPGRGVVLTTHPQVAPRLKKE